MTAQDLRLSTTLYLARRDARKTLSDISRATGISTSYLSQVEAGRVLKPAPEKLALLAVAYNVSYDTLMLLAQHTPTREREVLANLPAFIIEAGPVLGPDEWEVLRRLVTYLVKARSQVPAEEC